MKSVTTNEVGLIATNGLPAERTTSEIVSAPASGGTDEERTRHPLSAAFGGMPANEFADLVQDIKRNGLLTAITTADDGRILDGWHRYLACIEAGVKPRFEPFDYVVEAAAEGAGRTMTPAEFVCAQNAQRRHLTAIQKRDVITELLKASPEKSDRAIAVMAKVDHKTVAVARREAEGSGEIPQTSERKYADGRTLKKPAEAPSSPQDVPDAGASPPQDVEVGKARDCAAVPRRSAYMVLGPVKAMEKVVKVLQASAIAGREAAKGIKSNCVKRATVARTRAKLQAAVEELDILLASTEVKA